MLYATQRLAVPAASPPMPGAKCLSGENTPKGGHAPGAYHLALWRLAAPGEVPLRGVENAVHRGRQRGGRVGTHLASLLAEDLDREERRMRHPPCVLCEGLDTCRFLDCQEAIPEGQTLCWHCEAALAEDFAPDGPADVFYRTPEPWGGRRTPGHPSS